MWVSMQGVGMVVRGDSGCGRCRVRMDDGVNFKDWVVGFDADQ